MRYITSFPSMRDDLNIHSGKVSDMYTAYVKYALYGDDK